MNDGFRWFIAVVHMGKFHGVGAKTALKYLEGLLTVGDNTRMPYLDGRTVVSGHNFKTPFHTDRPVTRTTNVKKIVNFIIK